MELIKAKSAPQVWLSAVEHLNQCDQREDYDVFLNIAEPTVLTAEDAAVYKLVDTFLTSHGGFSINTVAETIFPLDEYLHGGAKGVFDHYPSKMKAIHKSRKDGRWGCYALRMLRQVDLMGREFNPLQDMVEKIRKFGKWRACYEMGRGRPFEDDIPIYDPALDRKPVYGNLPCLSHLSIKVHDGRVRFNATYRSHNYVQRLLGNLVGLGRLQYFMARETGLEVDSLTINSTFARLDKGSENGAGRSWGQRDIEVLIARCRAIYSAQPAAA